MKRNILFLSFLFLIGSLSAQSHDDALRYSQTYSGGTARSTAMGGAFGSLGGDFSSASINPAGLGFYRKSELTFTPEVFYNNTSTRYYGNEVSDSKTNFNLNNFGYVASFGGNKSNVSGSFALGFNRLNNYHQHLIIQGDNPNAQNSLADYMASKANIAPVPPEELGGDPAFEFDDVFHTGLFFDAFVLDYDADENHYYVTSTMADFNEQKKTIDRSGKLNEWVISTALNFNNVVYFGATFGIHAVSYEEQSYHEEFDVAERSYRYFNFGERLKVEGTGYTGKFGVIVKPIDLIRFGAAIHLPTTYKLSEEFVTSIQSPDISGTYYPRNNYYDEPVSNLSYDYKVVSPAKIIGSGSVILGKLALVSADVEFIDYSTMKFKGALSEYLHEENEVIKDIYDKSVNVKLGTELRFGMYRLRGGFAFYQSPFKEGYTNADADQYTYSAGFGIRDKNYFFDFTYLYHVTDQVYNLYSAKNIDNLANITSNKSRFMATIGFRF